jgi:RNase P subunit RPR2
MKYKGKDKTETAYCPNCRKIQTITVNNSITFGPKKARTKVINKNCSGCGNFISGTKIKV